jgi:hypothetical protein
VNYPVHQSLPQNLSPRGFTHTVVGSSIIITSLPAPWRTLTKKQQDTMSDAVSYTVLT